MCRACKSLLYTPIDSVVCCYFLCVLRVGALWWPDCSIDEVREGGWGVWGVFGCAATMRMNYPANTLDHCAVYIIEAYTYMYICTLYK